MQYHGNVP